LHKLEENIQRHTANILTEKLYVQKHFQDVQCLLESWRLALEEYSIKYTMLHCREKADSEFSIDSGCVCDKAAMIRVKD
jgi:hypothetical protein